MTRADCCCLLQQLAFRKSRHFSWDNFPANTMAYDMVMLMVMGTAMAMAMVMVTVTAKATAMARLGWGWRTGRLVVNTTRECCKTLWQINITLFYVSTMPYALTQTHRTHKPSTGCITHDVGMGPVHLVWAPPAHRRC